ncbi:hypothetical protein Tco_1546122 [Tanacetum coccineum]
MSTEVHQAAETVTTSNELDLLFGHLFNEYFNGVNQVVLKSSAVTTTDASDKRQQQPDSTSSTSTLATSVTADGNFDLSYALNWKPCQEDSLNLPDHSGGRNLNAECADTRIERLLIYTKSVLITVKSVEEYLEYGAIICVLESCVDIGCRVHKSGRDRCMLRHKMYRLEYGVRGGVVGYGVSGPQGVRALVMTINLNLPPQILDAHAEAIKEENVENENLCGIDKELRLIPMGPSVLREKILLPHFGGLKKSFRKKYLHLFVDTTPGDN